MRLSFLPEQLVRSSQQLVLMDTKKGVLRPWKDVQSSNRITTVIILDVLFMFFLYTKSDDSNFSRFCLIMQKDIQILQTPITVPLIHSVRAGGCSLKKL